MATQIILTDADLIALGGDPETGQRINTKTRRAIQPLKLLDGTWALSPAALPSATTAQRAYLTANCVPREVAYEEFQWVADAAKEQESGATPP